MIRYKMLWCMLLIDIGTYCSEISLKKSVEEYSKLYQKENEKWERQMELIARGAQYPKPRFMPIEQDPSFKRTPQGEKS